MDVILRIEAESPNAEGAFELEISNWDKEIKIASIPPHIPVEIFINRIDLLRGLCALAEAAPIKS